MKPPRENVHLIERLLEHAANNPGAIAVREIATGRSITYQDLAARVAAFAASLKDQSAFVAMLLCPNGINFYIAFLGVLAAGHAVFPVWPEMPESEYKAAVERAGAAMLIDSNLHVADSGGAHVSTECGLLLNSSGTTGLPKIVFRSAAAVDAVCANMVEAIGFTRTDRVLSFLPLCHSYGLEHGLLAPIWAGSTVHIGSGFDVDVVVRELRDSGITIFPAVPSICELLSNRLTGQRFERIRAAYSAGAPLPKTVFESLREKCGVTVGQLYGATEVGSVTYSDPHSPTFDPASVGKAMNGVSIRAPLDSDGEVLISAPSMFSSYVGEAERPGEYFATGDLGRLDAHGNLTITGRLKLLIDVGGLKVNPLEVETLLLEHPGVAECVVVPMKLSQTVCRLKAVVTPSDALRPPDAEDLRRFARERLTAYKVPRLFEVRASLPKSPTGKVLRHLIEAS